MQDLIGRTLGHYRIVEKIGEGGMGEVYGAHDERLDRDVAVKVLHGAVAEDPDRMARFEREAKLLGSLNHPNIATLYGLEEEESRRFLVMELVEGESLASVVARGAIPFDEALPIALQIAQALEGAHERGIIHRDLKPSNVMVDSEDGIKVLDFGLAKAFDPAESSPQSPESISESPTQTADLTRGGVLLGTAAYMSPEQARGKPVDKRADIWAFGCVLYEMMTGSRPFRGNSSTDVLAAVIKDDIDWNLLPATVSVALRRLLRRCLIKDPRDRLHDIADVRIELEEFLREPEHIQETGVSAAAATPSSRRGLWWNRLAVAGWVLAAGLALTSLWVVSRSPNGPPGPVARVRLPVPEGEEVLWGRGRAIAISPDGSRIVYVGQADEGHQLWLRHLGDEHATPVPGTEGARVPVFSPDGRRVAFQDSRTDSLKIVSTSGSSPVTLVEKSGLAAGDWGPDEMVYFGSVGGGISRVPASGGEVEVVTLVDAERGERLHSTVDVLPNGKGALLTISHGRQTESEIAVVDLGTRAVQVLGRGIHPLYVASGHLVYARTDGVLLAVPFDQEKLKLTGQEAVLKETASFRGGGMAECSISETGTLLRAHSSGYRTQPVWVGRDGSVEVVDPNWEGRFLFPTLSPDGSQIAVSVDGPDGRHIWIKSIDRGVPFQLTFEGELDQPPAWTQDGQRVTFPSRREEKFGVWEKRADGSGEARLIFESQDHTWIQSPVWSEDMRWLVYQKDWYEKADIYGYQPGAEVQQIPLVVTEFSELSPTLSPDGRWLAYTSNRTGRFEIYVTPFPNVGHSRWTVSTEGGTDPQWARNGRELFYKNDQEQLVVAEYQAEPTFRMVSERPLFSVSEFQFWRVNHSFTVSADGRRFLMMRRLGSSSRQLSLTLNLFEELKRLAPTE